MRTFPQKQTINLEAGGYYQSKFGPEPAYIVSNKPVMVSQFYTSYSADPDRKENKVGDPFMTLTPPTFQFLESYVFSTYSSLRGEEYSNHVMIIIETEHIRGILIDSEILSFPASDWWEVPESGYTVAKLVITPGRHVLSHRQPNVKFGAILYGVRQQESYGSPLGQALTALPNFCIPFPMAWKDGVDNDCDGKSDEEVANNQDDDGDRLIDEDVYNDKMAADIAVTGQYVFPSKRVAVEHNNFITGAPTATSFLSSITDTNRPIVTSTGFTDIFDSDIYNTTADASSFTLSVRSASSNTPRSDVSNTLHITTTNTMDGLLTTTITTDVLTVTYARHERERATVTQGLSFDDIRLRTSRQSKDERIFIPVSSFIGSNLTSPHTFSSSIPLTSPHSPNNSTLRPTESITHAVGFKTSDNVTNYYNTTEDHEVSTPGLSTTSRTEDFTTDGSSQIMALVNGSFEISTQSDMFQLASASVHPALAQQDGSSRGPTYYDLEVILFVSAILLGVPFLCVTRLFLKVMPCRRARKVRNINKNATVKQRREPTSRARRHRSCVPQGSLTADFRH